MISTTDFSYHGHPDLLNCPEGESRKSLALYYYSNGRPQHEVIKGQEKNSTIFKIREGISADEDALKKNFKQKISGFIDDLTPPIIQRTVKSITTKK